MAASERAIEREAILMLRKQVRFQSGRPYDACCSKVAAALEAQFGWKREWGRLRLLDERVCWQHCWNRSPDGGILDATADQFEAHWLGDLVVLEGSDPHASAYQPRPPGWTFTLREQEAVIELQAVRDDAREHISAMSCAGWFAAARQVLMLMTGWSLPDDIIKYAARLLRVCASLNRSITSGDLDGLLTMYELMHAAAVRGGPWMSAEYAALLA